MYKPVKYILLVAVIALVGYKSVYFKKLSEVKNARNEKFDAISFAKKTWEEKMPLRMDSAIELSQLFHEVAVNREAAFSKYFHAIAIGNYRYAIVKTQGTITEVKEDEVEFQIPVSDSVIKAVVATEYIYGNAIRDASGLIDVKDFPNTSDLNGISEELNKIVRTTVVPSFKSAVKKGDKFNITAAIEINKEHIKWNGIELIPLRLQIVQ